MTTTFVNEPIVPVELKLPTGTVMTLYQPGWQAVDDGSAAFLGKEGKVFAFPDLSTLSRFVKSDAEHDLTASPYLSGVQDWDIDKYAEELCAYDLSAPPELADGHLEEEEQASLGSTLALLLDLLDYQDIQDEHADALRDDHEVEHLAAGEQAGGLFSTEKRRQHVVDLMGAHWVWCVNAVTKGIEQVDTSSLPGSAAASGSGDSTPIEDIVDAVTVWFAFSEQGAYTLRTTTLHEGRPNYLGRYSSGSMSLLAATDVDTLRSELGSGKAGTLPGVRLPDVDTRPDLSLTPADDFIFDLVEIADSISPALSVEQADRLVTAWSELSRLTAWGKWADVAALLGTESPVGRFMVTVAIDRAQDRPGSEQALGSADTKSVQDAWNRLVEAVYAKVHLIDV
ncbi:hypothetical protein [Tenggerimyces flavus]|uniref:Uncharacterized protein n=1 Tax=Tenggerimyces flavus TaxID=1708749 RepID=A0ABV7Y5J6_9ACTN|nr:hypothetical protein [Tenggerimyces flavus]MBM7790820.1 hypothetical protein [Tenggerimyces flavus]